MAERLGNRATNQKVVGLIPGRAVVSLGKALHPTCLGRNVPVLTVNRCGLERLLNVNVQPRLIQREIAVLRDGLAIPKQTKKPCV